MSEHPKIAPFSRRTRRANPKPPPRPDWLHGQAAKMWDELAPEMARLGWLDELTAFGFAAICELSRQFQIISAEIARLGATETASSGVYASWLAIATELRLSQSSYFMDPASRAQHGVEINPGPK